MPTLDDVFNKIEAEAEDRPPVTKPSPHGKTPLIDATFAKLVADQHEATVAVPRDRWGKRDRDAVAAACRPLRAAYEAFLATPEAQAELAALTAHEASLPDEEAEPEVDEDEDGR